MRPLFKTVQQSCLHFHVIVIWWFYLKCVTAKYLVSKSVNTVTLQCDNHVERPGCETVDTSPGMVK